MAGDIDEKDNQFLRTDKIKKSVRGKDYYYMKKYDHIADPAFSKNSHRRFLSCLGSYYIPHRFSNFFIDFINKCGREMMIVYDFLLPLFMSEEAWKRLMHSLNRSKFVFKTWNTLQDLKKTYGIKANKIGVAYCGKPSYYHIGSDEEYYNYLYTQKKNPMLRYKQLIKLFYGDKKQN